jgi:hypothetical protein
MPLNMYVTTHSNVKREWNLRVYENTASNDSIGHGTSKFTPIAYVSGDKCMLTPQGFNAYTKTTSTIAIATMDNVIDGLTRTT